MPKINIQGKEYEDYTKKVKSFYLVDDLSFIPKDGGNDGQPVKFQRLAVDIRIGSKVRQVLLKPSNRADYEFLSMAEDVR